MKIGNWEFVWTRGRIAIACIAALALVGVFAAPTKNVGPTEPPEAVPPYPTTVNAQLPADAKQQVDTLARGAMQFVFFHEAGHMLISELNLPAIGPEEDVADEFATFYLTNAMNAAPDKLKDSIANAIFAGAMFWRISSENRDMSKYPWYDEHSPDQRRYYNIICIATGADPLRFLPLAVKDGVPQTRLNKCATEYKKKLAAWNELMAPHEKNYFDRKMDEGGHLQLQVGPVQKAEWLPFELTYKTGGFFQQELDGMSAEFKLPEDVPVIIKSCDGTVNAWWSPDTKTITLCHEMFQVLVDSFEKEIAQELQPQQGQQVAQNGGGNQGGGQQGGTDQGGGDQGSNPAPPQGGGQQQNPNGQAASSGGEGQDYGVPPKSTLESNVATPTPTSIPGGTVITTQQLVAAMQRHASWLLVDALNDGGRGHTTLPYAHRLQYAGRGGDFSDDVQQRLASDLSRLTRNRINTPIVFFCAGPVCWESYNAALRAERLGYTTVGWYRGGLQAWSANGMRLR